MTFDEIRMRFPNASQSFIDANLSPDCAGKATVVESGSGPVPLAAGQAQETYSGRVHVRFVSVRKRLLDPDNLCEKYALDCLRTIRGVSGDEPDKITLETTQRKAAKGEAEVVEITVFELPPTI